MIISKIKRPWIGQNSQGTRYNPDPFYHTNEWRDTRISFFLSEPLIQLPPINGIKFKNKYCVDCWKSGKITDVHTVDHIKRIKEGGSRTDHANLQGQCKRHHAVKSANEANESI